MTSYIGVYVIYFQGSIIHAWPWHLISDLWWFVLRACLTYRHLAWVCERWLSVAGRSRETYDEWLERLAIQPCKTFRIGRMMGHWIFAGDEPRSFLSICHWSILFFQIKTSFHWARNHYKIAICVLSVKFSDLYTIMLFLCHGHIFSIETLFVNCVKSVAEPSCEEMITYNLQKNITKLY